MAGTGGDVGGSGGIPMGTGSAPATGGSTGNSNGQGCGQGQFCQDGDDLAPPPQDQGFQIVTPPSLTVNPGSEGFWCYYKSIPGSGEVDIGGFRAWMTKGSSHHFITFHGANGPDGTLVSCAFGSGEWIFATSKSAVIVGTDLPQNVGLPYKGGDSLTLNVHVVNTGTDVAHPVVKLNVLYAKDIKYKAGSVFQAMLGANPQIAVPPGGTQTVRATCRAAPGSNFFLWTTHSHKFTTKDTIDYISGGQTTNIVTTTDWENPGTHFWAAPNFLTTKAGDTFSYSCTYQNPGALPITFGETAAYNEMCIAIGYYFPVDTTGQTNCF
jgi:hypothetical protein